MTAFVAHNSLPIASLAALIQSAHAALTHFVTAPLNSAPPEETQQPAVPIRKSVTPDYLVCLEDGKQFKSMRRHLKKLGMTPEQYRVKWGLPFDYPMVAASYAAHRSELAKQIGFGQSRKRGRLPKASK